MHALTLPYLPSRAELGNIHCQFREIKCQQDQGIARPYGIAPALHPLPTPERWLSTQTTFNLVKRCSC